MTREEEHVGLTPSMIPSSLNFDVRDSSFFRKWSQLPTPKEVRAQADVQRLTGVHTDPRKVDPIHAPYSRAKPPPVLFEEMGLLVKWGSAVEISEAQCLYAIRRFLKDEVPVPEVYGWCTDGKEKYIYMEYVKRQTLEQDPLDAFIGNIIRAPLYDRAFHPNHMSEAGPFATVCDFHNWFTFLYRRPMPDPHSVPVEPFRQDLPDNCALKFTHGDLHRSNIIVTPSRPYRTLAIIDWEQSGWLPAYWEARKAQYTADWREEWSTRYLPMILDQYTDTWDPWDYYTTSMGC